jgi:hypothetical protein
MAKEKIIARKGKYLTIDTPYRNKGTHQTFNFWDGTTNNGIQGANTNNPSQTDQTLQQVQGAATTVQNTGNALSQFSQNSDAMSKIFGNSEKFSNVASKMGKVGNIMSKAGGKVLGGVNTARNILDAYKYNAQGADLTTQNNELEAMNGIVSDAGTFDSLASDADNLQTWDNLSYQDTRGTTGWQRAGHTLKNMGSTFATAKGGLISKLAQTAAVGISGLVGNFVGNSNARYNQAKMNAAGDIAEQRQANTIIAQSDKINDAAYDNQMLQYAAFGGNLFDTGGNMDSIFSNGVTEVNAGGTHEQNPLEGVPMGVDSQGTPNLVEEGEVIRNDYVYSNRLHPTEEMLKSVGLPTKYKKYTYAKIAEELSKESKERPNDPISLAGIDANFEKLKAIHEQSRMEAQEKTEKNIFWPGGDTEGIATIGDTKENISQNTRKSIGRQFLDGEISLLDNQEFLTPVDNSNPVWTGLKTLSGDDPMKVMWHTWSAQDAKGNEQKSYKGYTYVSPEEAAVQKAKAAANGNKPPKVTPTGSITGTSETGQPEVVTSVPTETKSREPLVPGMTKITRTTNSELFGKAVMTGEKVKTPPKSKSEEDNYVTWMRYAPILGTGAVALSDALGLTNQPDYSPAEAALMAARNQGRVRFNPIGDYVERNPLDRNYYLTQLANQNLAAQRASNNAANRYQANAINLASMYNAGEGIGKTLMQMDQYNAQDAMKAAEFNRGTNQYNSEGSMKEQLANRDLDAKRMEGILTAAKLRADEKQRAAAARSANLTTFLDNLGALGQENMAFNMVRNNKSEYYGINRDGSLYYKPAFFDADDETKAQIEKITGVSASDAATDKSGNKNSKGGYLTIKNKKRR